jgi:hypothetical protein
MGCLELTLPFPARNKDVVRRVSLLSALKGNVGYLELTLQYPAHKVNVVHLVSLLSARKVNVGRQELTDLDRGRR